MKITTSIGIEKDFGVYTPLIPIGAELPFSREVTLLTASANQGGVAVNIRQGERLQASENRLLGTIVLRNIERAGRAVTKIALKLEVVADRVLVVLTEKKTGRTSSIDLPVLAEERQEPSEEEKTSDIKFVQEAEDFFLAHYLVEDTGILLRRIKAKINSGFIDKIDSLVSELQEALIARDYVNLKRVLDEMDNNSFEFEQYCSLYGNAEI